MIDSFKKGLRIGVGMASKTAQEVETAVESFVRSKHLPSKKAKALAREILKVSKAERKKLLGNLRKNTKKRLKTLHAVSRKEADKFVADVIALKYTLNDTLRDNSKNFKAQAQTKAVQMREFLQRNAHKALHSGLETMLDHLLAEEEILEQKTRKALKKVKSSGISGTKKSGKAKN